MAKRPVKKFSEVELFFISGNAYKLTNSEIAEKLGCNLQDVKREVDKIAAAPSAKKKTAKDFFHKQGKNNKSQIVVMTESASRAGDDSRKEDKNENQKGVFKLPR